MAKTARRPVDHREEWRRKRGATGPQERNGNDVSPIGGRELPRAAVPGVPGRSAAGVPEHAWKAPASRKTALGDVRDPPGGSAGRWSGLGPQVFEGPSAAVGALGLLPGPGGASRSRGGCAVQPAPGRPLAGRRWNVDAGVLGRPSVPGGYNGAARPGGRPPPRDLAKIVCVCVVWCVPMRCSAVFSRSPSLSVRRALAGSHKPPAWLVPSADPRAPPGAGTLAPGPVRAGLRLFQTERRARLGPPGCGLASAFVDAQKRGSAASAAKHWRAPPTGATGRFPRGPPRRLPEDARRLRTAEPAGLPDMLDRPPRKADPGGTS
ncbi:hypothetical protein ISCGN_001258 [Ixodes scapularis]